MYTAELVQALGKRTGAHFFGLGGPQMRDANVELVGDYRNIAVVGLTEYIAKIPAGWKILAKLVSTARRRKPALAIVVDSPALNLHLSKFLKWLGIRVVYFISPQVWAWRPGRANQIRRRCERILVIFPFEEKFYRDRGMQVNFVGHPLVDSVRATVSRGEFCSRHGLDPGRKILVLLPGSRQSELRKNLPRILAASRVLSDGLKPQFVLAVAPGLLSKAFEGFDFGGLELTRVQGETYNALAACDCAIVSSGTATVEAALLGTPMVVVYAVSQITALLAKPLLRAPFIAMVNLIAGREVVPELIQDEFTSERLAEETRRLLVSVECCQEMKKDLAEVRARLGPGGAINRAAEILADML